MKPCKWCGGPIPLESRRDAETCGKRCRQAAFRLRRRRSAIGDLDRRMRFAYADPPYPGLAHKYYRDEPSYAGEVDYRMLIDRLEAGGFDGWALSTSARSLVDVLPMCPRGARVCSWVKPIGASGKTHGLHNCWEALIVVRGRHVQPGIRDWLRAMPARSGGELPGRKPLAFCAWLFDCLGMIAGDELEDLFPGSGIVTRSWRFLTLHASTPALDDTSQDDDVSDVSSLQENDA